MHPLNSRSVHSNQFGTFDKWKEGRFYCIRLLALQLVFNNSSVVAINYFLTIFDIISCNVECIKNSVRVGHALLLSISYTVLQIPTLFWQKSYFQKRLFTMHLLCCT